MLHPCAAIDVFLHRLAIYPIIAVETVILDEGDATPPASFD